MHERPHANHSRQPPNHASASRPSKGDHAGPAKSVPSAGTPVDERYARDHAVLAAALDPIITIDPAGIIQSASDSVLRVLGWLPVELIGQNVNILMPEPHHSAHGGYLEHYHRTGQTNILNRSRRFEAMRKDGTRIPIELCVTRANIPGGSAPLFVGIIRDMSDFAAAERSRDDERVRAQQQLAEQTSALLQANARLRMADRMASIGTLAAGLGHDMNNVLLPVRARLNALKASGESGNLPRSDRKHVEEIQRSVGYLQQLADGLHFLALDSDTEEDTRGGGGSTDLGQWWSQSGSLLSKAVPKHVRVAASIPADLPPVAMAAHRLTQAVLNLIVNAGEAIPPPGERKRRQGYVRMRAERLVTAEGAWIRLGVTDNGTGMSEDVKRRVFEMFYTTKPRGLGTGLGLPLVRKVVEQAGGHVEIESEVGKGTTVLMTVPTVRAADPNGAPTAGSGAVISVKDGRANALMRHLLESSGTCIHPESEQARARVWIVDPATIPFNEVKLWRNKRPLGRLVLLGQPDAQTMEAWLSLDPVMIDRPDDFESIRTALRDAIED